MREELEALAVRCKGAAGPDRELDTLIWLAVTPGATRKETVVPANETRRGWTIDETREASGRLIITPSYTGSIDAAMTLELQGWLIEIKRGFDDDGEYWVVVRVANSFVAEREDPYDWITVRGGVSLPITITAAWLRARAIEARSDETVQEVIPQPGKNSEQALNQPSR
jgi:hypothetical protein